MAAITKRLEELAAMIATVDTRQGDHQSVGRALVEAVRQRHGATASRAATGLSGNDMDRDEKIRRLSIRLAGEGVRVGQALGYQLEHIRMHDPETLARAAEGDRAALDEVESSRSFAGSNSNTRSELARPSMGQDMLKGRRTEIDFINGVIADKGEEIGRTRPDARQADRRGQGGRAWPEAGRAGEPLRDLKLDRRPSPLTVAMRVPPSRPPGGGRAGCLQRRYQVIVSLPSRIS